MSEHNRPLESYPHLAPGALDHFEQHEVDDPELYFALGQEDYQDPYTDEGTDEASGEEAHYKDVRLAEICEELNSPTFKQRHTKPRSAAQKLETEAVAVILGVEVDDLPDQSMTAKEYDDYEKRFARESDRQAVVHEFLQRKLRTIFHFARIHHSKMEPTVGATIEDVFQTVTEIATQSLYVYRSGQNKNLDEYLGYKFRTDLFVREPHNQAVSTLIKVTGDTRQALRKMPEDVTLNEDPHSDEQNKYVQGKQALNIEPIEVLGDRHDDSFDVLKAVYTAATRSEVRAALSQLSYREKTVLKMRYGIGETVDEDNPPATLSDVGAQFSVTRERVRQIENQASKLLVKEFKKKPGKYPFIASGETHEGIEPHNAAPKPAPTMQKVHRARRRLEALDGAIAQSDEADAKAKLQADRTTVNRFLAKWDPAHGRITAKKKRELEEATPALTEADSISNDQPTPAIESPPSDTAPPNDAPLIAPQNFQVRVNVKTPIPTLQNSPNTKAQQPEISPQQPIRLRDKLKRIFGAKSKIS